MDTQSEEPAPRAELLSTFAPRASSTASTSTTTRTARRDDVRFEFRFPERDPRPPTASRSRPLFLPYVALFPPPPPPRSRSSTGSWLGGPFVPLRQALGHRRRFRRGARPRPGPRAGQVVEPPRSAAHRRGSVGRQHGSLRAQKPRRAPLRTVIANWIPAEDTAAGPNWYALLGAGPLQHQDRPERRRGSRT